jgi:DNA-binding Lrp family transcriptional regulator
VSVSAVAASLGLPFETVRRRLNRLAKAGECVIGPKGVLVPTERLMAPDYVQIALARYERTRRLYHDLSAMGAVPPPSEAPPPAPPLAQGGVPVRLCNRLLSEYFLRSVEILMRAHGDPVTVLIILGLVRANLAALSPASRAAPGILPESQRIPVRRSALAQQLGMPTETVRRRLLELEQRGFCRSTPGGVLISIEAVTRPDAWELMQENYVNLSRFFGRLRRFGLLDLWDSDLRTAHAGK